MASLARPGRFVTDIGSGGVCSGVCSGVLLCGTASAVGVVLQVVQCGGAQCSAVQVAVRLVVARHNPVPGGSFHCGLLSIFRALAKRIRAGVADLVRTRGFVDHFAFVFLLLPRTDALPAHRLAVLVAPTAVLRVEVIYQDFAFAAHEVVVNVRPC